MTFITSSEMRQRDLDARVSMERDIDPVTGYNIIVRGGGERGTAGMMFSYNLQKSGRPDVIITGTTQLNEQRHKWVLNSVISGMLSKLPLENKYDYALDINRQFAETKLHTSFVAIVINTNQWLNGFGLNHRRFYGDLPYEKQTYIQIVEINDSGEFPAISTNSQILLPTVDFNEKEPTHASVLPHSPVPCESNRQSCGTAYRQ